MARGLVVDFLAAGLQDTTGEPLASGKVYTYDAGTTTPRNLYTNIGLTSAAANPVILDANGVAQVYGSGAYKFVIKNSSDVTQYTFDNIDLYSPDVYRDVSVTTYGAVGDGVTNDTTAVQAALDSGNKVIYVPSGTYLCGTLTVPTTVQRIYGPGTLKQRTANSDLLSVTSSTELTIEGLKLTGITGSASASSNNAIVGTSCSNLKIIGCTFTGWRYNACFLLNCSDVVIANNYVYAIAFALIRGGGCKRMVIENNIIRDTFLAATELTNAIAADTGTYAHAYGVGYDITISGNVISGYPNAQAIFFHAGKRITISGNSVYGSSMAISCGPYSGAADDLFEDVTVIGNTCIGTTTTGPDDAGETIYVAGKSGTYTKNVVIAGNTVRLGNANSQNNGEGGISVGYIQNCSIVGNSLKDCYNSGISIVNPVTNLVVQGNAIYNVQSASGQNGIFITSSATATKGRIVDNLVDTATYGINVAAACPDLVIERNQYLNLSASQIFSSTNAVCDGRGVYTAADTTPSVKYNVRTMNITNGSACTITNFDDGQAGQMLLLRFEDSNTTIQRNSNIRLSGSANFTSAYRSTLLLYFEGTEWIEVARTTNNG